MKGNKEETMKSVYVLTEVGKRAVSDFIAECTAKRKELLDAGKDTAEETTLPDEAAILSDLNCGVGVDSDGDYFNGWSVTDHYDSDTVLGLHLGKDFIELPDGKTEKAGDAV